MPTFLWIIDALQALMWFLVAPWIAVRIGYAAWKGKPKGLDREKYGFASFAAMTGSAILFVCMKRMNADVRSWWYLVQLECSFLGALLFGIATGCGFGIFTYRSKAPK
jgi:hypothetical protein